MAIEGRTGEEGFKAAKLCEAIQETGRLFMLKPWMLQLA